MSIERKQVGPRLSQAVVHGDTVYTAGVVAEHPTPDPAVQTGQILAQIDKLLADCGSDKSKLLMATIWLADIRYFDEMNSVWDKWVVPGQTPARACVEARLAHPKYLVEIRVVAAR
jgi:enamine deaminase RidA (YjgF/YER057c/UK114 family)